MNKPGTHTVYTIGHSTRSLVEFLNMLQYFKIKIPADIRSLPGSRKYLQFNKEDLKISLEEAGIQQLQLSDLGGRRKVRKDSKNNHWNNDPFKGYADYMETEEFECAIINLERIA